MSILFKAREFQAECVHVPNLSIGNSEWILLSWPTRFGSKSERKFYALIHEANRPEFEIYSRASVVLPVGPSLNLGDKAQEWPDIKQLLDYLPSAERDMLTRELSERNLLVTSPIDHLPGTLILLAGLCLAFSRSRFVVFNVAGIDPVGVGKVYSYVLTKLKQGFSVIELVFLESHNEQPRPVTVSELKASTLL